jgi:hypothetical protein
LKSRDQFFLDSVHLSEEGQALIGQYLAKQLLPLVRSEKQSTRADVSQNDNSCLAIPVVEIQECAA